MSTKWGQPSAIIFAEWLGVARIFFWAGAFLALAGFTMLWIQFDRSFQPRSAIMFAGYGLLILAGSPLLKQGARLAAPVPFLAFMLTLSMLVMAGVGLADILENSNRREEFVWGIIFLVALPGHAALLFGALAVWILRALEESIGLIVE